MEKYIVSVWQNESWSSDKSYYKYKIFQINDGYKVEWFHYTSQGEVKATPENYKEKIEQRLTKLGILNNIDECTIEYNIN
jgi:hypothetical protein